MLQRKRIYEKPSRNDGIRVLVDRLWPRGLAKAHADVHIWMKNIAPSTELRQWFSHDPKKWKEFQKRYTRELQDSGELRALAALAKKRKVTLVYGARDEEHSNVHVLEDVLRKLMK